LNNTVCQKESLSNASGGNSVYFTFSSLYFFCVIIKTGNTQIDKVNGAKKCCFTTHIGASTYNAGIRWELQGHTCWTLAEAYGWLRACVVSWQPFIWQCLCHYQNKHCQICSLYWMKDFQSGTLED